MARKSEKPTSEVDKTESNDTELSYTESNNTEINDMNDLNDIESENKIIIIQVDARLFNANNFN